MFLAVLTFALLQTSAAHPDPSPRAAIELYFKAHALGDGSYIRQAFTSDAEISFVDHGELKHSTSDEFAGRFHGPAADEYQRVRRVESLDVGGDAASAVVTLDYPQVLFRDHLSLLKINGDWKIVNKVFSADHRDNARQATDDTLKNWSLPFEPRKIIGNIYYVGSNMISSFLIVTPAGHILIDTGHAQMLPQVEANIEKLGFHPKDVKLVLNSHAHFDHCGGFAEFKRQTGVTVVASKADGELMMRGGKGDFSWGDDLAYEPVKPDRFIADAERVELGGVTLTAHLTPGHTKGCTSWSLRANESEKTTTCFFCAASLCRLS